MKQAFIDSREKLTKIDALFIEKKRCSTMMGAAGIEASYSCEEVGCIWEMSEPALNFVVNKAGLKK